MKRVIAILIAIAILVGVYFYQRHRHEQSISLGITSGQMASGVEASRPSALFEMTERTTSKATERTTYG